MMKRKALIYAVLFSFGAGIVLAVVLMWGRFTKEDTPSVNRDYLILQTQIQEMNKMVVLEQNFSSFQQHHGDGLKIVGQEFGGKDLILYSTARAQLSYDLKLMKLEIDSIGKRLIVKELPRPKLEIFPEVKIHMMNDNVLNRYEGSDLAALQEDARQKMIKNIQQQNLKTKGHEVLMKNLNSIFILAKTLGYTLDDQTMEKSLSNQNL